MNSAERAERLRLVVDEEADRIRKEEHAIAAKRRRGSWLWRPVGVELQFRSKALPTVQLDLLRTEARDLMLALGAALGEKPPKAPRMSKADKARDARARRAWDKAHGGERAMALRSMAEEFASGGGW
jgi:hypothetical protein